jgi:DNA polymerase-3 subunit epsilon
LLAEVLEDGVLTDDEAASLAGLAKTYSLTRDQVAAAHRGFLLALAHKAIEDGKITRDERAELLATAATLGFPDGIVKAVLDEAHAALAEQRGKNCKPLPDPWPHGEPLHIGDGVAFTGCDELVRARLEGRAQAAGLRVTGSVSSKTVVLVTDGADPYTTKAEAARQFNTRIVTPDVFAELVYYVQPVKAETGKGTVTATIPAPTQPVRTLTAAGAVVPALPATGSAIRAWARAQGLPVGVRGRLPADIVAAYASARGLDTATIEGQRLIESL